MPKNKSSRKNALVQLIRHAWMLAAIVCIAACKPGPPSDVLSASEMEDVLYDYHMAQAMAQQSRADSIDFNMRRYQQAVFAKHHIDEAAFDHSMEWYERHTERLDGIYKNLTERFGESSGDSNYALLNQKSLSGDTLNLWHGDSFVILNSQLTSHHSFSEKADTAVQEGDIIQWRFFADWHYHDGQREATALLAIHYEGDSVATTQSRIFDQGLQMVTARISKRKVLRIEGFIYQHTPWTSRPRILVVSLPQLLRIRRKEEKTPDDNMVLKTNLQPDGDNKRPLLPRQRLRDSLLRADSLQEAKPHFR